MLFLFFLMLLWQTLNCIKYNRRKFLASLAKAVELPSLKGKKILYTYGGWDGHEPKQSVELFQP